MLKNPRHPSIGADGILCVHQGKNR